MRRLRTGFFAIVRPMTQTNCTSDAGLFQQSAALASPPSSDTLQGFEPRVIGWVRMSIIINFVTSEWRCLEQLACPEGLGSGSKARETR